MKLTTRELVTIAIFGTMWGIVEMTLGGVLKSLDIPMSGVILASIGMLIALVGRMFVPKRGTTIFIGVIATILKLFSLGGVIIGPMIGILTEALVAELILSIKKTPNRAIMMTAGALGVSLVVAQPFVTGPLLLGRSLVEVWLGMINTAGQALGLSSATIPIIFSFYILIHIVAGMFSGFLAWKVGRQVSARLGKQTLTINE
jgi:ABC-type thiamin/hydroxymethylpyrimidine transport system permease subunit